MCLSIDCLVDEAIGSVQFMALGTLDCPQIGSVGEIAEMN